MHDFSEKTQKSVQKSKKALNIWKVVQKCTECENSLKKGKWLCVIMAHNKLLQKALL